MQPATGRSFLERLAKAGLVQAKYGTVATTVPATTVDLRNRRRSFPRFESPANGLVILEESLLDMGWFDMACLFLPLMKDL